MNKSLTTLLSALAVLACTATAAFAVRYPPGTPGGVEPGPFPDTLSIVNLQNPASVPFPAAPDTVYGVGGIITGFDPKPSGFGFWIQLSNPGTTSSPFTGINVFTGSWNFSAAPFSLAVGDSVIVYGKKQEFGGGTEIEGLDNTQGTQDVAYRKISSGNPLPPFYVGTVTNLNVLPTNTNAEQREGMLVRINGPMRVARNTGVGTNNFYVVDGSVPPASAVDSVLVDGNTLTTYAPPSLNTIVNQVQGILEQRAPTGGVSGYRIQLRDGNDIQLATPPNFIDAYPLTDNTVRVIFDRDVTTASATTTTNYTLGSFGTVDAAVMDGQNRAILTITNSLPHGVLETVTAVNIVGLANGNVQTSPQSRTFWNGVLTAAEIQAANPDSLNANPALCFDKSKFAGTGGEVSQGANGARMSVSGTVTGVFGALTYLTDDVQGARSGVSVFAPISPMTVGRRYLFVGAVQEFFGESEVSDNQYILDLGPGAAFQPVPAVIADLARDTCDYTSALVDGEEYEGVLVKVSYAKVVQRFDTLPTNGFHIASLTSPDTIFVSNLNNVLSPFVHPPLASTVSVTGVLHYANNSFRICPRNYDDILNHGLNVGAPPSGAVGRVTFAAAPNPTTSRASLTFGLPSAAEVDLGVYDVTGRSVATLAKGLLPAGSYSRTWDGRSANGSRAPAGVYFYKLRVGGETFSIRSVKLGN